MLFKEISIKLNFLKLKTMKLRTIGQKMTKQNSKYNDVHVLKFK